MAGSRNPGGPEGHDPQTVLTPGQIPDVPRGGPPRAEIGEPGNGGGAEHAVVVAGEPRFVVRGAAERPPGDQPVPLSPGHGAGARVGGHLGDGFSHQGGAIDPVQLPCAQEPFEREADPGEQGEPGEEDLGYAGGTASAAKAGWVARRRTTAERRAA